MNKYDIKYKLRESLESLYEEEILGEAKKKKNKKEGKKEDKNKKDEENSGVKSDYSDVQLALDKNKDPIAPSQVGVMKKMGIKNDSKGINRSLFGKKLHQEKNDDGSFYQFTPKELARLRGVIDAR